MRDSGLTVALEGNGKEEKRKILLMYFRSLRKEAFSRLQSLRRRGVKIYR